MDEKLKKEEKDLSTKDFASKGVQDNKIVRFQEFIQNNSKKVSYISIGVIVAVALLFFLKNYLEKTAEEKRQTATVALSRIMPYYDAPDYRLALYGDETKTIRNQKVIGLIDIVKKYESTNPGKIAALYAGNSFLAVGKAQDAVKYFEIAMDSPSKVVVMGANAGLGGCNELLKKYEEAATYYEKAAELSLADGAKNRLLYFAGTMYEKLGNKEKAEKVYRGIVDEDQYSEYANYAKAGLTRLGMIIE
jgi:tetratricopeptide (TPR) repeat protein